MAIWGRYVCPHCGGTAWAGDPRTGLHFRGGARCDDCGGGFSAIRRRPVEYVEWPDADPTENWPFVAPFSGDDGARSLWDSRLVSLAGRAEDVLAMLARDDDKGDDAAGVLHAALLTGLPPSRLLRATGMGVSTRAFVSDFDLPGKGGRRRLRASCDVAALTVPLRRRLARLDKKSDRVYRADRGSLSTWLGQHGIDATPEEVRLLAAWRFARKEMARLSGGGDGRQARVRAAVLRAVKAKMPGEIGDPSRLLPPDLFGGGSSWAAGDEAKASRDDASELAAHAAHDVLLALHRLTGVRWSVKGTLERAALGALESIDGPPTREKLAEQLCREIGSWGSQRLREVFGQEPDAGALVKELLAGRERPGVHGRVDYFRRQDYDRAAARHRGKPPGEPEEAGPER